MSLPEIIPSNLPQYIQLKNRSSFANSVLPHDTFLLFAESDGQGGSRLVKKNPDGSFSVVGGGSSAMNFYKCASVGSGTWTGYLAYVDPVTGEWSFASTATTAGLTYSWLTPVPGKVYAGETCLFEVARYNSGTSGHSRFALTSVFEATDGDDLPYNASYNAYSFEVKSNVSCLKTNGLAAVYTLPSSFSTDASTVTFWGFNDTSYYPTYPIGLSGPAVDHNSIYLPTTNHPSDSHKGWEIMGNVLSNSYQRWVLIALVFIYGNEYVYAYYQSNEDVEVVYTHNSTTSAGAGKVFDSLLLGNCDAGATSGKYIEYLADLQIWNRALSQSEIKAIYNAGPHGTPAA